MTIDVPILYG